MSFNKSNLFIFPAIFIAIVFGVMTIKSGGAVLFTDGEARVAAGDYVNFVLWFNFLAGFLYIVTGIGLWVKKQWAGKLAVIIATLTILVFSALGVHILLGGNYEIRTVAAMTLRSVIWITIALVATRYKKQTTY